MEPSKYIPDGNGGGKATHHDASDGLAGLLTPSQVSDLTGIPEYTIRKWAREGVIDGLKLSSRWYIRRELVESWLTGKTRDA